MYEPNECKYYATCGKINIEKEDGKIGLANGYRSICGVCSENKAGVPAEPDEETMAKIQADFDKQAERLKGGDAMKK